MTPCAGRLDRAQGQQLNLDPQCLDGIGVIRLHQGRQRRSGPRGRGEGLFQMISRALQIHRLASRGSFVVTVPRRPADRRAKPGGPATGCGGLDDVCAAISHRPAPKRPFATHSSTRVPNRAFAKRRYLYYVHTLPEFRTSGLNSMRTQPPKLGKPEPEGTRMSHRAIQTVQRGQLKTPTRLRDLTQNTRTASAKCK
jgi:hypothetical protein